MYALGSALRPGSHATGRRGLFVALCLTSAFSLLACAEPPGAESPGAGADPGASDAPIHAEVFADGLGDAGPGPELVDPTDAMDVEGAQEIEASLPADTDASGADAEGDDADAPGQETIPEVELPPEVEEIAPVEPPRLDLRLNALPHTLDGSEPFLDNDLVPKSFHLAVPPAGFTLDIHVEAGSAPVAPESLWLRADVVVGDQPAGAELGAHPQWLDGSSARWLIPPEMAFALSSLATVEAGIGDTDGLPSEPAQLSFEVRELPPELDPFVLPDLWLLDFRRDFEAISAGPSADGSAYEIASVAVPEGNGSADFEEVLLRLGLLGPDPVFNQGFIQRFRSELRKNLHRMFLLEEDGSANVDSVRIRFVFDGEPDAPDPAAYDDLGDFSMIGVGGDSLDVDGQPTGYMGMAWLDWGNQEQDDNSDHGHGVFFTALMRKVVSMPGLKPLLAPLFPGEGLPLGAYDGDLAFLDEDYNVNGETDPVLKQRFTVFRLFMQVGGIGLAALASHEMGHSLGLVAPGAPPAGLFGGASEAGFVVGPSDGAHIDTAGANLMQTGKSLKVADFLSSFPAFNPLNLAYLQRRIVVDPSAALPAPPALRAPKQLIP